jgi:hypothetical protein
MLLLGLNAVDETAAARKQTSHVDSSINNINTKSVGQSIVPLLEANKSTQPSAFKSYFC